MIHAPPLVSRIPGHSFAPLPLSPLPPMRSQNLKQSKLHLMLIWAQMTEILAMRREEQQLREQLTAAEQSNAEAEAALEAARLDAVNRKAEQER